MMVYGRVPVTTKSFTSKSYPFFLPTAETLAYSPWTTQDLGISIFANQEIELKHNPPFLCNLEICFLPKVQNDG